MRGGGDVGGACWRGLARVRDRDREQRRMRAGGRALGAELSPPTPQPPPLTHHTHVPAAQATAHHSCLRHRALVPEHREQEIARARHASDTERKSNSGVCRCGGLGVLLTAVRACVRVRAAGCHGEEPREHDGRDVRAAGPAGCHRGDRLRQLELLLRGEAEGQHGDTGLRA